VVLLGLLSAVHGSQDDVYANFFKTFPRANRTAFYEHLPQILQEQPHRSVARASPSPTPLPNCPSIATPAGTDNVNNLRPGNIKVVMAMGDSITAGMSAKDTTILSLNEYRGLAYSIGGDSGLTTLPNILKEFSPALTGFSTGKGDSANLGLNAAVSGDKFADMITQAEWLVDQLNAATNIDIENDWKLLTIWIGSNNLCDVCDDDINDSDYDHENDGVGFEAELIKALDYLYDNVPRVFVNLVANLDIAPMGKITTGICSLVHTIVCDCVTSTSDRTIVSQEGLDYQNRATTIAATYNSRNNPLFAVVVQPFLTQTVITDRSQLSAADCFHPTDVSHTYAAVALWNNLISPANQKQKTWAPNSAAICPTADTLLYTN